MKKKFFIIVAFVATVFLLRFGIQQFQIWSFTSDLGPAEAGAFSSITYKVKREDTDDWQNGSIVMRPGETYDFRVQYRNTTEERVPQVALYVTIPDILELDYDSVTISNVVHPDGTSYDLKRGLQNWDGVPTLVVELGNYAPAANAYVDFQVTVRENITFELSDRGAMWVAAYSDESLIESCEAFEFLRANHLYGSRDAIITVVAFIAAVTGVLCCLKFFS